jgi:nicotinate phosphoribosyltransferase
MKVFHSHAALYTDLYQLMMAQGYYLAGRSKTLACFDYFFRENPFHGGYAIFAGISDLLEILETLKFEEDELEYLREYGFRPEFLSFLQTFRFNGTIHSVREGELVFPLAPLVRVEGNLIEAQIIETLLLNLLNFETLIATKASRIRFAAGQRRVVDFGLRRAQGLGGIHASKAAVIGGVDATSNVYAAYHYGLQASGTQAHSWVQSFGDELTAFRSFAEFYPDRCYLLVDTYNTLRNGIPNAIIVAKEMEQRGHRLLGIRLDSGDLAYLSKRARTLLDEAGLNYVQIVVSNQLDEYLIRSLIQQEAPIDAFGVGTRLVTAMDTPALDGVYKMSVCGGQPTIKFSDNYTKMTLPGKKKILRYCNEDETFDSDGILLDDETQIDSLFHPFYPEQHRSVQHYRAELLLGPVMENGKLCGPLPTPHESARFARKRLEMLTSEYKRFENPHQYKVGISRNLKKLRTELFENLQRGTTKENAE